MAARSLNRVQLIGNLTRDPELRYTPQGTAVCTFGLATNRSWTTDTGEKREETEFHRIVSWNKLAELCSQLLAKGRKVYVEGRLSTRSFTGSDGNQRSITEVVIDDMIILDSRRMTEGVPAPVATEVAASEPTSGEVSVQDIVGSAPSAAPADEGKKKKKSTAQTEEAVGTLEAAQNEEVSPDDIPF